MFICVCVCVCVCVCMVLGIYLYMYGWGVWNVCIAQLLILNECRTVCRCSDHVAVRCEVGCARAVITFCDRLWRNGF